MAKYKSGIGDNEDLMPYKTYGQEDLHFDIKINATGKQIKDVYGYPPIKATYNLYTSCKKDMPIYKEDNYDIDIETYPNFLVDYYIQTLDQDNNVLEKYPSNAPDVRLKNAITKLDGTKELLRLNEIPLNLDDYIGFIYKPTLLLEKLEDVSMSDVYNEWVQFDKSTDDGANWQYDPENDQIYNLSNQNGISGYYNPNYLNLRDYTIEVKMFTDNADDDMMGFCFRFQDEDNYYSFQWDNDDYNGGLFGGYHGNGAYLFKTVNGNRIVLDYTPKIWRRNTWEDIKIEVKENTFKVYHEGKLILSATDNTFTSGSLGPISMSQPRTYFKNLKVSNINISLQVSQKGFLRKSNTENVLLTDKTYKELLTPLYNDYINSNSGNYKIIKYYTETDREYLYFNESIDGNDRIKVSAGLNDCIPWKKVKIQFVNCSPSSYVHMYWSNNSNDITTNKNDKLYVHTDYCIVDNFKGTVQQPIPTTISLPDTEEEHLGLIDTLTKDPDKYKVYYKLVNNNPDNTSTMFISPTEENENISVLHGVNGFVDEEGNPMHDFVIIESTSTPDYEVFEWTSSPIQLIAYLNRGAEYEKEEYKADLIVEVVGERAQRWQIETDNGEERSEITYFPEQCSCEEDEEVEIPGKPQKPLCGLSNMYHIELIDTIDLETNTSIDLNAFNIEFANSTINNKTIFDFETPAEIVINSDYTKVVDIREAPWVSNKALESKDIEKQTIIKNQELWTYNIDKSNLKELFNIPDDVRDIQLSVQTSNLIDSIVVDNGSYFTIVCKRKDQDGVGSTRWYPMIHNGYFYID